MSTNFKQILTHLTDNKTPLKLSFLYTLSKLDAEKLAQIEATWPKIDTPRRRKLLQLLTEISEDSFEVDFSPIFIFALNDADAEAQILAIKGLWENESPALVPVFLYLMKSGQSAQVRAAAASALGVFVYLGEIEEVDADVQTLVEQNLLETIRDTGEDLEVARRAIESISFSGREGLSAIIEDAFYHENELMRVSAVFAMGRSANNRWADDVISAMDDDSPAIRFEAARASGEIALESAVPKLAGMIVKDDEDLEVKQNAIWALGQIGGDTAKTLLESLTESTLDTIRETAEEALDELLLMGDDFGMLFNFDRSDNVDMDEDEHTHDFDLN